MKLIRGFVSVVVLTFIAAHAIAEPQSFTPGEIWPDDRGKHIQAHGGGIIKHGDTFFWFGEDRTKENNPEKRFVACYSSTNLAHWTFRNQVLKLDNVENLQRGWVLERPKVYFNVRTKKFVMYFHIDGAFPGEKPGYNIARVGVAVCDTVADPLKAQVKRFFEERCL